MNLFIFAHQDDEFGVFAEIDRLVQLHEDIVVIYLTTGTFSGNISSERCAESINVLSMLGVKKDNILFLGNDQKIPDGRLCEFLDAAYESLNKTIEIYGIPKCIYMLAWEGGHQDHDAAHVLGVGLANKFKLIQNCYQFTLYSGDGLPGPFFRLFGTLSSNGVVTSYKISWRNRLRFIKLCFLYKSQKMTWFWLFPFLLWHYVRFGSQLLQPISLVQLPVSPHMGRLLYERRGHYLQSQFTKHKNNFLKINKVI